MFELIITFFLGSWERINICKTYHSGNELFQELCSVSPLDSANQPDLEDGSMVYNVLAGSTAFTMKE